MFLPQCPLSDNAAGSTLQQLRHGTSSCGCQVLPSSGQEHLKVPGYAETCRGWGQGSGNEGWAEDAKVLQYLNPGT